MTQLQKPIDAQLHSAQVAINNALTSAPILTALSEFGYTSDRLQRGKALYTAALNAQMQQKAAYGDQIAATVRLEMLRDTAHTSYMRLLKIARVAFRGEVGISTRLGLNGIREKSFAGWLTQAEQFYANVLTSPDLLSRLTDYGITTTKLEAGQAEMNATRDAHLAQEKAKGEAQHATQVRDVALTEMNRWLSDFVAIARIALEDTPQRLESLGIVRPA